MKFTPTIGMEVHVELKTKSKMFCGCPADHFGKKPNTQTCPVCLGLPGALPVPNKKAIDWTVLTGLALHCKINRESTFDRKHYFYPDLPKGFQISQYDDPFCYQGFLDLDSGKTIRIRRVHLEEDTAKLLHKTIKGKKVSLIDFNRSGVPLMEIVTDPDMTSGQEAKEFLKKLRDIIKSLGVSDCDMEKGSLRLEANISLSQKAGKLADYKVEIKNLNSFRFVDQAINYEIDRQTKLLRRGIIPKQETRGFNPKTKSTFTQRGKEAAADYRYFPEPDIPPIVLSEKDIAAIRRWLPTLPDQQITALIDRYKLSRSTAGLLTKDSKKLEYFRKNVSRLEPNKLANLIINKKIQLDRPLNDQLKAPAAILDPAVIDQVLRQNPEVVKKYQSGKTSVLAFLIGQVMRLTQGKADPQVIRRHLLDKL